jgi:hypothetical protein
MSNQRKGASPRLVNPCSAPATPVQTWGTRPGSGPYKEPKGPLVECALPELGGADRDRTGDPLLAKQVLSQLSYSPLP